jgi:hypothetical protein
VRTLRRLLLAIVLDIVLFFALVFGAALIDRNDKADAARFCARTPVGQPWAELARRIVASNADQPQSSLYTANDGVQSVYVTIRGFFPMERHMCIITLESGRVDTKLARFMD